MYYNGSIEHENELCGCGDLDLNFIKEIYAVIESLALRVSLEETFPQLELMLR